MSRQSFGLFTAPIRHMRYVSLSVRYVSHAVTQSDVQQVEKWVSLPSRPYCSFRSRSVKREAELTVCESSCGATSGELRGVLQAWFRKHIPPLIFTPIHVWIAKWRTKTIMRNKLWPQTWLLPSTKWLQKWSMVRKSLVYNVTNFSLWEGLAVSSTSIVNGISGVLLSVVQYLLMLAQCVACHACGIMCCDHDLASSST